MRTCEICGEEKNNLSIVIFEGKRIYACNSCIKKYSLIRVSSKLPIKKTYTTKVSKVVYRPKKKVIDISNIDYELVEDFGDKVKRARESLGLTQAELASRLKIKVSLLRKIESGKFYPAIDLVKKLEKNLNIKLLEKVSEEFKYEKTEERPTYAKLGDFFPVEGEQ